MGSQSAHYHGLAHDYRLSILGEVIDSDTILSVTNINSSAEFPEVGNWRVTEFTVRIGDPDGLYSPKNDSNFFVANSHNQSGIGAAVSLQLGLINNIEEVFVGEIIRINLFPVSAEVEILCVDRSWRLGRDAVKNFGLQKRFHLFPETEQLRQQALNEGTPRSHGRYPILEALTPSSEDSATLFATALNNTHSEAENLRVSGDLDPTNFVIREGAVETEGGLLELTAAQDVNFPQVRFKSPYRFTHFSKIINELLTHYDITDSAVTLPNALLGQHLSSNGRAGYDLVNTDQFDLSSGWRGFVTDVLYHNNKYYFLYSISMADALHRSRIITYDITDYSWSVVYTFGANIKAWRMALTGDLIYVMIFTDTGQLSPNPFDNPPAASIVSLSLSDNSFSTLVNNGSSLRPYPFRYYHTASGVYALVPESRISFVTHNGALYYPYVDASGNFGCAVTARGNISGFTKPIAACTMRWDDYQNMAGCSFDIRNNLLYVAYTHRDAHDSALRIVSVDISSIPTPT